MSRLSRKERLQLPRTPMPVRPPAERVKGFEEVNLGYDPKLAIQEARRCLQCPHPRCVEGCPVGVRIDEFIAHVAAGDLGSASRVLAEDNSLPAICGRVCPQESQCEELCPLARKDRAIAIGHLERFVADFARENGLDEPDASVPSTGRRVAIVGSGPSGLACAYDLAKRGHEVVIFEALHEPGGVLVYGIPEFRLSREVVAAEVDRLRRLGVRIVTDAPIGLAESMDDLLQEYDAVFVGVGAGSPTFLGLPGEQLMGVSSANEFLTRVNLMQGHRPGAATPVPELAGRRVMVVGGGNTAFDAVRTALRLGASEAILAYRRSEEEMPARPEEINHAREEGVSFELWTSPVEFLGDGDGGLRAVRMVEMEPGPPEADGRRRPVPVPGSETEMAIDVAIVAVGTSPNQLLARSDPGIKFTARGTIEVDPATGATSRPGVYAGGDIVTGAATVIEAMGAGRLAAASIHEYLVKGTGSVGTLVPSREEAQG